MASNIKLKRSAVQSRVPTTSDLELGELGLNTYDGKVYMKKDDGTAAIVEVGGGVADNSTHARSIGLGPGALADETTGYDNTAVGSGAAESITDGRGNSAFGENALQNLEGGIFNTVVGHDSSTSLTSGSRNTSLGYYSLKSCVDGDGNVAIGNDALQNATGDANVAIGHQAGDQMTTGSNNTFIGYEAQPSSATVSNEITLGHTTVTKLRVPGVNFTLKDNGSTPTEGQVLTADTIGEGYWADTVWTEGTNQLYPADAGNDVLIGGTLPSSPNITLASDGAITAGTYNTLTVGKGSGSVATNTAVGLDALDTNTTGTQNTALGRRALQNNTEGNNNTAVGALVLQDNTTGGQNTALGYTALTNNTIGSQNTALGRNALSLNTEGDNNTAVGNTALNANTTGDDNTAVGNKALQSNATGNLNTAVGQEAGFYIEGSSNTILGAYKGTAGDSTLSDTVIISAGTTERMRIDSSGDVGIGGTLPSAPNISLNADGSGTFATALTTNSLQTTNYDSTSNSGSGCRAGSASFTAQRPSTSNSGSNMYRGYYGSTQTFAVNVDGTVQVGGVIDTSPNISLNADGIANAVQWRAGDVTSADLVDTTKSGCKIAASGAVTLKRSDGSATSLPLNIIYGDADSFAVQNNGTVLIGGTLPSSPNITLASDGAITAGTYNTLTVGLGGGSVATNTAVGKTALPDNTTGILNTAIGLNALLSSTEGDFNTALGVGALGSNTTGDSNTAVGLYAGFYIEGSNNTILGAYQGTSGDSTLSDTVIISAGTTERARCDSSGNWEFPGDVELDGALKAPTIVAVQGAGVDGEDVGAKMSDTSCFRTTGDGTQQVFRAFDISSATPTSPTASIRANGDIYAGQYHGDLDGSDLLANTVTYDKCDFINSNNRFLTGNNTDNTSITAGRNSDGTYMSSTNRAMVLYHSENSYMKISARHSSSDSYGIQFRRSSTDRFRVASSGAVTNTTGTIGTISDIKLKRDITDATPAWDEVKALKMRNFYFNDELDIPGKQLGYIAQEVEEVCPSLVENEEDLDDDGNPTGETTKTVKTSIITLKAVKALQEAMARIEELEAKVQTLEANQET